MPGLEHVDAMRRLSPSTLIDVGANKGQFSLMARHLFPKLEIHAFEPLETERRVYESVVSQPVTTYPVALGPENGEATFFVATRADSSSLLKPGEAQEIAYDVTHESTIKVPVSRMVDVLDFKSLPQPVLIKLDVQGAEIDVMKGAEDILPQVHYIYCEASFVPLYEGQFSAGQIIGYLARHGFMLRGVYNQSNTKDYGPTQADLLFENMLLVENKFLRQKRSRY